MICHEQEMLNEMIEVAKPFTKEGKVATYIPALGKANPETLAVSIFTTDGECFSAGNSDEKFTLQSISKVITLGLALLDHGEEFVFSRVGMEPTGDPFNSISKLETSIPSKPLNPMINAGALAVTNMIMGNSVEERLGRILTFIHELTNNTNITYNKKVAQSEFETAYLNRSLCYFMKQHGIVEGNVEELLDVYTKQCAIELDCKDVAKMGYIIGNEGVNPETNRRVIPIHIARIIKTFMVTCGMYNASGEFAIRVGIPAKSGVSGGIIGAVPHGMGIGIYGPALDDKGNSVAGMKLLEGLSNRFDLSIF